MNKVCTVVLDMLHNLVNLSLQGSSEQYFILLKITKITVLKNTFCCINLYLKI